MGLAVIPGVALLAWAAQYGYHDLQQGYAQLAGLLLVGVSTILLVCFRWMGTGLRALAGIGGCVLLALGLLALSVALAAS